MSNKIIVFLLIAAGGYYYYTSKVIPRRVSAGVVSVLCNTEIVEVTKNALFSAQNKAPKNSGMVGLFNQIQNTSAGAFQKSAQITADYVSSNESVRKQFKSIDRSSVEDKELAKQIYIDAMKICPAKLDHVFAVGLATSFVLKTVRSIPRL